MNQRPGMDPQVWVGVAAGLLTMAFVALVVHLVRLAA